MKYKAGNSHRLLLLSLFLLLALSVSFVGISYARYSSSIAENMVFETLDMKFVQLHGITEEKNAEKGQWHPLPIGFTRREDGAATLDFCVSNGASREERSYDEMQFAVQLSATEGFLPEKASVALSLCQEDGVQWIGVPTAIRRDSYLYPSFGEGYLYHFYDENGQEVHFDLSASKLSLCKLSLTVQGEADVTLLRLFVIPKAVSD